MGRRSDTERRRRREPSEVPIPTSVCYCDGKRELGTLELHCSICRRWFHQKCLRDLTEFYGLPFMVCYVFKCQDCTNDKRETWTIKQTNFAHMCVMALANMTYNHIAKLTDGDVNELSLQGPQYFDLEKEIVPFFDENWESLTNMSRRVKNSWHQTISKTLGKETELFVANPENTNAFALSERDLLTIGPLHVCIKNLGRRAPANQPIPPADSDKDDSESGPKTRGAAKRRAESSSRNSSVTPTKASTPAVGTGEPPAKVPVNAERAMGLLKKGTLDADAVVEGVEGSNYFPFNREGMQYFYTEKDIHVSERDWFDNVDAENAEHIPPHIYRLSVPKDVVLSTNDRANQLVLSEDRLTVTGELGYAVARSTHSVMYGKWYYEVEFLEEPPESCVRIGWCQTNAHLQACLGYNKLSYGWRSRKGTKFHNAYGYTYFRDGYGKGDVLGCMIELAERTEFTEPAEACRLPPTKKDTRLLNFKGRIFFEEKEEPSLAQERLVVQPGSKISFFKNGQPCGTAYEDIFGGTYYPAVSIYHPAVLRLNFGPTFKHPPPAGVRAISERAFETDIELALADMLYLTEKGEDLREATQRSVNFLNLNVNRSPNSNSNTNNNITTPNSTTKLSP